MAVLANSESAKVGGLVCAKLRDALRMEVYLLVSFFLLVICLLPVCAKNHSLISNHSLGLVSALLIFASESLACSLFHHLRISWKTPTTPRCFEQHSRGSVGFKSAQIAQTKPDNRFCFSLFKVKELKLNSSSYLESIIRLEKEKQKRRIQTW